MHEHVLLTSDGEDIEAERDAYASAYAAEHGVGDELDAQLRKWGWLYAELTYAELCEQEQGWPARHLLEQLKREQHGIASGDE